MGGSFKGDLAMSLLIKQIADICLGKAQICETTQSCRSKLRIVLAALADSGSSEIF